MRIKESICEKQHEYLDIRRRDLRQLKSLFIQIHSLLHASVCNIVLKFQPTCAESHEEN